MFLIPNYVRFLQGIFDLFWTPTPYLSQEEISVPTIPDPFFWHLPPASFVGSYQVDCVNVSYADYVPDPLGRVHIYLRVRVSVLTGHYARSPCFNQSIRCELLD